LIAAARAGSSIVYLCPAPVGPFGASGAPMRSSHEGFEFPSNRPDGTSVWDPESAIETMYPRLPAELAQSLAERLKPGASPADPYPQTLDPGAPTTVIYGAYDEFFRPEWSRWVAREVARVDAVEIQTGHFPMLEAPDDLAAILLALV
jgi:pimeloyl-ACP methyl ester carboxylesterase